MSDQELCRRSGIREQVLNEIRTFAGIAGVKRVWLFGSRARGDYDRASDIDLASDGGDADRLRELVNDAASTLLKFDVIDINSDTLTQQVLESIKNEGIILYEKMG